MNQVEANEFAPEQATDDQKVAFLTSEVTRLADDLDKLIGIAHYCRRVSQDSSAKKAASVVCKKLMRALAVLEAIENKIQGQPDIVEIDE